ncbi:helix-turn-helix transcriptional regulator [Neobacillus jeddahensis]|uniref:helix-turn-helix transcriptional regulator n=1 Tax=Neobacillus jeddahensis TaxID=1461580 RepID=UPI00058FB664|nr:AraC family transcriptional regulator [Neobacillus jeddahensis]
MDLLWKINIERPLAYYKCGQFVSAEDWKHKEMLLSRDFELIIGIHHSIYIQVESRQYEIQPGDVLLIPPGVPYFGYLPSQKGASFFWLHFFPRLETVSYSKEQLINHLMASEIDCHKAIINSSIFLPAYFRVTYTDKPYILMKQILDIANASYYSTFAVDYVVTELLIELTEQYHRQLLHSTTNHTENSQKFAQILEWIRVNIYEDLSVKEIADSFSFNPDHLTRLFKKNLRMSTIRYINTLKINKAKELLCTTNKTIKEISYDLKFKDEKYFMRLFKNYEGITPSQFRDAYIHTYINTLSVDPDIPVPAHLYQSYT